MSEISICMEEINCCPRLNLMKTFISDPVCIEEHTLSRNEQNFFQEKDQLHFLTSSITTVDLHRYIDNYKIEHSMHIPILFSKNVILPRTLMRLKSPELL